MHIHRHVRVYNIIYIYMLNYMYVYRRASVGRGLRRKSPRQVLINLWARGHCGPGPYWAWHQLGPGPACAQAHWALGPLELRAHLGLGPFGLRAGPGPIQALGPIRRNIICLRFDSPT